MSASTMTMEKASQIAQERIAELEQANEIWRADFAKLKAENQRLREAVSAMNPNNPFSVIEVQAMVGGE